MDKEERVEKVAKSLADLKLVSNWEEAVQRARQIVENEADHDRSLKELMADLKKETSELDSAVSELDKKDLRAGNRLSREAEEINKGRLEATAGVKDERHEVQDAKAELKADAAMHKAEKKDIKFAEEKVGKLKHTMDDTEFLVDKADELQKKKSKK